MGRRVYGYEQVIKSKFASKTTSHAHTITLFQCSLCEVFFYAKKHKNVSGF